jgi:hypothetical protein
MKTLLTLLTATLLLATACTQQKTQFTLHGTITGYEGETIYLRYGNTQDNIIFVDSAEVTNGKFLFKGNIDQPYSASLLATVEQLDWRTPAIWFYIEPGTMHLIANWDAREDYTLTGSITNDESRKIRELLKTINFADIDAKMRAENISAEERAALNQQRREMSNRSREIQLDFIKENPASYIAASYLKNMQSGFNNDMEEYKRL